ncbi:uncharacterized protein LOC114290872 [Camellia sinensis]|uniref:uncharacterized protein LOC114290872 n=1 Tax=Camellia sinensis TaxID=4442 RepID=UPI00103693AB|nr:uncharacterized protein LOC114290872 [Camellia sinensis]
MEVVSIMFYWGGKILRNRDEGVSYDTEPQGLYNVHRGITLGELEAMMVSKVGTHGEIMRLEFKCRLLCRGKYRLLPIKDNETLSNVLELPHRQGPSAPTTYNPMVLTTPYPHWNEECPPICNVQHTTETTVQNYASSDDTVPLFDELGVSDEDSVEDVDGAWKGADNDSGDDEVGGHHDMQEPLWDFETAHLEKGMIFTDKKRLVHAVQLYNLKHNRECKVVESKGNSWVAECKHGCNWRVRAMKLKDKDFFQIRRFEVPHQCVYPRMNRDNCNLKSEVIAHFIKAQIAISPELPLATIIEVVNEKFQFTISYKKAWLARTKAVAMVFGDWDESYRRLPRYMAALQAFNPGTVVMWDMILNLHSTSIGTEMYMNYVFWAFKPAIEGFKYCRPVIYIDSTHLYGKYEGKIVAATAVTAADKIVPLAFAVVDKEMIES